MTILDYCKDKRRLLETVLICDDYPISVAKRASIESKLSLLNEIIDAYDTQTEGEKP